MPPQQDNGANASGGGEATAVVACATGTVAVDGSSSYWEAPAEESLQGKRLSRLDLSSLEHQRAPRETQAVEKGEEATNVNKTEPGSYWDAPTEKGLEGKRLSKMDLTALEAQHLDKIDVGKKKNAISSYWEWQGEKLKSTLSNLSLSKLSKGSRSSANENHENAKEYPPASHKQENYWEWSGEKFKQTLSNLSLSNLAKGSRTREENATGSDNMESSGMGPRRLSNNSYWFWKNSSMNNLNSSEPSLTALENTCTEGPSVADVHPCRGNDGGGLYWFWRNSSTNSLSAASTVSLDTLDKKVRASESGKRTTKHDGSTGTTTTSGPITNLQHRMRNSWKKSFQNFSTNSLSKLDEDNTVSATKKGWKEAFTGKKKTLNLDNDDSLGGKSACSNGSFGEGAITF
ncbi:hypothetical protein IV203_007944 [Nitzschia inconspicua]|uniref:Uncharacterized protein n=1 Tax=Nitzschia inconspicua TaxID=303405 RepID=A0A9K3PM82_9STRA|nr:hypothetical protein IV203_007944 [Nitzschia inconspicua]